MITPKFLTLLIETIAKAVPAYAEQSAADRDAMLGLARTLFEAFQPTSVIEAALAARAAAAYLATMDCYARAAKPGVSDEKAVRLRGAAIAASRLFDMLLKSQRQARAQRPPATVTPQPAAPAPSGSATAAEPRVYHRADLPPLIPGFPATTAPMSRKDGWRTSTALTSAKPTVPMP